MAAAHHEAAAQAASVNAAVMHPLHGYPAAAAYGYSPHAASLLPYMGAAPQAMAVSSMTGGWHVLCLQDSTLTPSIFNGSMCTQCLALDTEL
jgi:hypothetical protein